MKGPIVVASAVVVFSVGLCWGATIHIKPDGTGDVPTIGAGMATAAVGDTLLLASGIFQGAGNHDLVVPDKHLVIKSETGDAADCVIDCEGTPGDYTPGLDFRSGTTVVEGLTITNADYSAMYVHGTSQGPFITVTVSNCVFSNCTGSAGAIDIYCSFGRVAVTGCRFLSNSGWNGGAVFIYGYDELDVTIDACTFCGNSAGVGGGAICCSVPEARAFIRNSVFYHNSAKQYGGAIEISETRTEVTGCTFFANEAPMGSGIDAEVYEHISRCIIAYGKGGCGFSHSDPSELDPSIISCTDIYGNEGGDWVDGCIPSAYGQGKNFSACPGFCNSEFEPYDLHLCQGSPCLPGNHPNGYNCGLIGALGMGGCQCGPSDTQPSTWGSIKSIYK